MRANTCPFCKSIIKGKNCKSCRPAMGKSFDPIAQHLSRRNRNKNQNQRSRTRLSDTSIQSGSNRGKKTGKLSKNASDYLPTIEEPKNKKTTSPFKHVPAEKLHSIKESSMLNNVLREYNATINITGIGGDTVSDFDLEQTLGRNSQISPRYKSTESSPEKDHIHQYPPRKSPIKPQARRNQQRYASVQFEGAIPDLLPQKSGDLHEERQSYQFEKDAIMSRL